MKNLLTTCILATYILAGCSKGDIGTYEGHIINTNYPTTYHSLPTDSYNALKTEYLKDKDSCFETSLNAFGFCGYSNSYSFNCTQNCKSISQANAKKMLMDFLQTNKKYTGIMDTSQARINAFYAFGKSYQCNTTDSSLWNINLKNQVVDGLEIENTGVYVRLDNNGIKNITGNWYPVVTIPSKEVVSYDMAKMKLLGKEVDFLCWTPIHIKIDTNTKWTEPLQRKIIYPLVKDKSIELHVVWVLQTGFFTFYVDVMTGEELTAFANIMC